MYELEELKVLSTFVDFGCLCYRRLKCNSAIDALYLLTAS
jgi:hypothetical protein